MSQHQRSSTSRIPQRAQLSRKESSRHKKRISSPMHFFETVPVQNPAVVLVSFCYADRDPWPARKDAAYLRKFFETAGMTTIVSSEADSFDSMLDALTFQRQVRRQMRSGEADGLFVILTCETRFAQGKVDMRVPGTDRWETLARGQTDWPGLDKYIEQPLGESIDQFRDLPRMYVVQSYERHGRDVVDELIQLTAQRELPDVRAGNGLKHVSSKFSVWLHRNGILLFAQSSLEAIEAEAKEADCPKSPGGAKEKEGHVSSKGCSAFARKFVRTFRAAYKEDRRVTVKQLFYEMTRKSQEGQMVAQLLGDGLRKTYYLERQDPHTPLS